MNYDECGTVAVTQVTDGGRYTRNGPLYIVTRYTNTGADTCGYITNTPLYAINTGADTCGYITNIKIKLLELTRTVNMIYRFHIIYIHK